MNDMLHPLRMIGLALILPLMVSCGSLQSSTSRPDPPASTYTAIPATPECDVICDVDTEGYDIEITCESGGTTVTYKDSTSFEGHVIEMNLDQERTYENTGNTYRITGEIVVDESPGTVSYQITVTGGVFGDRPRICSG